MNIQEKIFNLLKSGENVEFSSIEELPEEFRRKREKRLQEIEEREKEFQSRAEKAVKELQEKLSELEEFSDPKDRAVVEDVISNIEKDRKSLVEDFQPPENPKELENDLESFLEDFRSMTRKEAAVMEEAGLENIFSEQIGKIENLVGEIEEFIEEEFQTARNLDHVKEKQELYLDAEKRISEIQEDKGDTELEERKQKLEEEEDSLKKLENSSSKEGFEQKKNQKENLTEEIDLKTKKISSSVGKMQRGLKKMIYDGEIGKVSSEASEALREIRDGEDQKIISRNAEVIEEAAEAAIKSSENSDISGSTRKKLLEGAENLKKFGKIKEEVKNLKQEREEIQEELESHEYQKKKEKLADEIGKLENEIDSLKQKRNSLEKEKEEQEEKKKKLKEDIQAFLNQEFGDYNVAENFWKTD